MKNWDYINWNECLYLYQTEHSKQAFDLLNQFYFSFIIKSSCKILKTVGLYEFSDLTTIGYTKFIDCINTFNFKQKDFLKWCLSCVINHLKNEIRKIKSNKKVMNLIIPGVNSKKIYRLESLNSEKYLWDFLNKQINKINSDIFKKIFELKKEGWSYKEISQKLNFTYGQVRGCWDYYRKKISEQILIFNTFDME